MILLLAFFASLSFADGGGACVRFDLQGKTLDPRWEEFAVSFSKAFQQNKSNEVEVFTRRSDGKSWSAGFTCTRMEKGGYGCYSEDDSGFFRLEMGSKGSKLTVPRFVDMGDPEEKERILIKPKEEEIEVAGKKFSCQ